MRSLAELRGEIDEIDGRLARLLRRRLEVVDEIGEVKRETGAPVSDPSREMVILERVASEAGEGYADDAKRLFASILDISKARQRIAGDSSF